MKKNVIRTIASLVAGILFLAGCGTSTTTPPATSSNTDTKTETTGATAPQEFTFSVYNDPDSLDPNYTQNTFGGVFFYNLFVGLVGYDLDNNLVPAAAKDWTISDDGLVYTFHLREDLKWSDGTDCTAADFEYAWKRILDPNYASQAANLVYPYIKNGEKAYNKEVSLDEVGIKTIDPHTLEVTLEQPTSFLLPLLATWEYMPVCKAVVESNPNWTKTPETYISNGPFKLKSYQLGHLAELEKNEYFYKKDTMTLDKLNIRIITDLNTAFATYEKGEVDGIIKAPNAELPKLKARDDYYPMPQFGDVYYLFNTTSGPLADPKVRRALALAIDRTSLVEDVLQANYLPYGAFIPAGYLVDGKDFTEGAKDYGIGLTANVEEAKALLAEAGFPNGEGFPKLRLGYYTNDEQKKVAEALHQMWKENLNIEFEIVTSEWKVYYDQVTKLDYDICAMGELGSYLHPMAFFQSFIGEVPALETGWRDPAFEALVKQFLQETDEQKSVQLMHQAEDLFMDALPVLPLYARAQDIMMKDYVVDWNYTPTGYYVFDEIKIEK